jgi:signal transduction histidine kinase
VNPSIRSRVRIILAIAAIVPVLVVGLLAIYRANAEVESEVVRGRLAQVSALASSLDETLQGARRSLELAGAWWADEREVGETNSPESQLVMHRLWRRLHREVPIYSELSILDIDGKTIFGEPLKADPDLGAHSFGGFIGDVVYDEGAPYVPVVTQARNRAGERIGVLVARIDLSFVANTIEGVPLGKRARLLVLDGRGQAIARTDSGTLSERDPTLESVVQTALGRAGEGEVRARGRLSIYRSLVAFQSRRAVPWVLVLDQPEAEAFALARQATWDTAITALVVLALVIILGAMLATQLTRPLWLLAKRADAIAEGQVHTETPPLSAPGEMGVLAKRLEEMAAKIAERETLQAALAHEDRLATVGTMAASVAHEINNPLTTILGYSQLLAEDKNDDHPDHAGLVLIADEATRMKNIVSTMLEYSRSDSGTIGSAELLPVLQRVQTLLAPALKKMKVHLSLELDDNLPAIAAGSQSLQQIFVNLIQNASQAMEEGGKVWVAAKVVGDSVVATVRDEGPGIPIGDQSRVFDTFYTTKKASQGTGLGLAVVKHLVSEFRGSIEAGNRDNGDGTCMTLVIPTLQSPGEQEQV